MFVFVLPIRLFGKELIFRIEIAIEIHGYKFCRNTISRRSSFFSTLPLLFYFAKEDSARFFLVFFWVLVFF